MMFVVREQKAKGLAATSSVSAFLGVTEPAIFGVNIRYRYPFIFGMIGSAIAGMLLTVNQVRASSIGVGEFPVSFRFSRISGAFSLLAWLLFSLCHLPPQYCTDVL